jgi:protein required for attachment to host cells
MSEYTVVVADTFRARFFTLENARDPETESGPKLMEREGMANPDKELTKTKRAGEGVSGRNRSPSGGIYAFDDHRARHEQDALRRFVHKVITQAVRQTRRQDARRCLVIAAEKKVLGALRQELAAISTNGMEIRECDRDMAGETSAKIQELLARRKLIPAMKKPARTSRGLRG